MEEQETDEEEEDSSPPTSSGSNSEADEVHDETSAAASAVKKKRASAADIVSGVASSPAANATDTVLIKMNRQLELLTSRLIASDKRVGELTQQLAGVVTSNMSPEEVTNGRKRRKTARGASQWQGDPQAAMTPQPAYVRKSRAYPSPAQIMNVLRQCNDHEKTDRRAWARVLRFAGDFDNVMRYARICVHVWVSFF